MNYEYEYVIDGPVLTDIEAEREQCCRDVCLHCRKERSLTRWTATQWAHDVDGKAVCAALKRSVRGPGRRLLPATSEIHGSKTYDFDGDWHIDEDWGDPCSEVIRLST